jgi:hypothetical protein
VTEAPSTALAHEVIVELAAARAAYMMPPRQDKEAAMTRNVILEAPRPGQEMASAPQTGHEGATWARVTAVGGLVFFGLFIAFGALTSNTPAATDTRQEVFRYLARHHDRLQLAAALYGLAMLAALVFLSGLFATLRKAEGRARLAVAALLAASSLPPRPSQAHSSSARQRPGSSTLGRLVRACSGRCSC